jgi:hypothetical protein
MRPQQALGELTFERVATWIAAGTVAVFLIWSAIRIREITALMYQNSDIASAPVLAELLGERGSGYVTLGYYPWLEPLYALRLTRWLPDHLTLWKALPFVVYGASVALFGWTVMRAVSTRAGLLVALAMAAPAPTVIYFLGAPNHRLGVFAHAAILAAFLITAPRLAGWGWAKRIPWALALAVILAPGVASDPLVVLSAALPFLAAVGLGWRLGVLRPEIAGLAAAACAAGALGGRLLEALAEHNGIVYEHTSAFTLASGARVFSNAGLVLEDVALFVHGQFALGEQPIDALYATRALVAVVAIVGVVLFAFVVVRTARGLLTDDARSPEQRLLAVYWGVSIVATVAAFLIVTSPVGVNSVRYVTTLWPALLTLLAIVYGRRALTGLAVLAAGSAILGCFELAKGFYTFTSQPPPEPDEVRALERFVDANDLDHGYAGYWDAMPIMLQSRFRVRAYPIEPCDAPPAGEQLCEFNVHTIDSWYEPKKGVRSFYVLGDQTLDPAMDPPPPEWGMPFATASFGDLTVYAYDYDIASNLVRRLGPDSVPVPRRER